VIRDPEHMRALAQAARARQRLATTAEPQLETIDLSRYDALMGALP